MLINALVTAVLACVDALVSLFPSFSFTLPNDDIVISFIAGANRLMPLATALALIGTVLTLRLAMFGWDIVVWIFHQFWGSD